MSLNDRDERVELALESEDDHLPLLSWQVHLLRRHPWRGLAALVTIVALMALVWLVLGPFGALLLGLASLLSLSSFFLPQRFALFQDHVRVRQGLRSQVRPWRDFRRVVRGGDRILLSPFSAPHPLETWRGVILVLDQDDEQVWSLLRSRLDPGEGERAQGMVEVDRELTEQQEESEDTI